MLNKYLKYDHSVGDTFVHQVESLTFKNSVTHEKQVVTATSHGRGTVSAHGSGAHLIQKYCKFKTLVAFGLDFDCGYPVEFQAGGIRSGFFTFDALNEKWINAVGDYCAGKKPDHWVLESESLI
jgi:hypothetical protein